MHSGKNTTTALQGSRHSACLQAWDAEFTDELHQQLAALQERRRFLAGLLKSSLAISISPLLSAAAVTACSNGENIQAEEPWHTFARVQEHLFPKEADSPGAADIHATGYLKFVLAAPDTAAGIHEFLLNGIGWLNDYAREQKGKRFIKLSHPDQDVILQKIATSRAGQRWLSTLLLFIFEALLCAPVYGGNPDGIGWRWLEHQPGFPLPPMNKRYMDLL